MLWLILSLVMALILAVGFAVKLENDCYSYIASNGFKEADARAFIRITDFSCSDLKESDGAMAQFKRFLNGEEMTIKKTESRNSTVVIPVTHYR